MEKRQSGEESPEELRANPDKGPSFRKGCDPGVETHGGLRDCLAQRSQRSWLGGQRWLSAILGVQPSEETRSLFLFWECSIFFLLILKCFNS